MSKESINHISRESIRSFFGDTEKRIFKTRELQKLIAENRTKWGIPASVSFEQVVECAALTKTRLTFPSRPEVRYCMQGQHFCLRVGFVGETRVISHLICVSGRSPSLLRRCRCGSHSIPKGQRQGLSESALRHAIPHAATFYGFCRV